VLRHRELNKTMSVRYLQEVYGQRSKVWAKFGSSIQS